MTLGIEFWHQQICVSLEEHGIKGQTAIPLGQQFSLLSVCQNQPEGLWKHRTWDPAPQFRIQESWGAAQEFAFPRVPGCYWSSWSRDHISGTTASGFHWAPTWLSKRACSWARKMYSIRWFRTHVLSGQNNYFLNLYWEFIDSPWISTKTGRGLQVLTL